MTRGPWSADRVGWGICRVAGFAGRAPWTSIGMHYPIVTRCPSSKGQTHDRTRPGTDHQQKTLAMQRPSTHDNARMRRCTRVVGRLSFRSTRVGVRVAYILTLSRGGVARGRAPKTSIRPGRQNLMKRREFIQGATAAGVATAVVAASNFPKPAIAQGLKLSSMIFW